MQIDSLEAPSWRSGYNPTESHAAERIRKAFPQDNWPVDGKHPTIFGWYHFESQMQYLEYDPDRKYWDVLNCDEYHRVQRKLGINHEDWRTVEAGIDMLFLLPPPPLPQDTSVNSRSDPFAHEGWLYAWFYFPELKRWIVGPLEPAAA